MRRCLLCGGSASGAAGGFITGLALTGDFDKAWSMAGQGALSGGITGGVLGGYRGYKAAQHAGNNPWTGESLTPNKSLTPNNPSWNYGDHKSQTKWENQMKQRGWTEQQINEALHSCESYPAPNNISPNNGATRYVHPTTGRSIVIDNVSGRILHVGGDGFLY